jgi:hypothetical protein
MDHKNIKHGKQNETATKKVQRTMSSTDFCLIRNLDSKPFPVLLPPVFSSIVGKTNLPMTED